MGFREQFDEIASEQRDLAQFAVVDVMNNEYLKETYQIKHSPYFLFLLGSKYYEYEGARTKEAIRNFITKFYHQNKKAGDIPAKVTKYTLYITYLNRYLN